MFTRLPDLSQNTLYYSTERTCPTDKVGILHIKQKIPEPGRKRKPDSGIPFFPILFYSICTPSIARPKIPAYPSAPSL